MGPCWLAHKRLESWSRIAKERVNAVRRDRTEDTSVSTSTSDSQSNSMCDSTDLNLSMEVNGETRRRRRFNAVAWCFEMFQLFF